MYGKMRVKYNAGIVTRTIAFKEGFAKKKILPLHNRSLPVFERRRVWRKIRSSITNILQVDAALIEALAANIPALPRLFILA